MKLINDKEQERYKYWNIFQWEFLRRSKVYRKDYETYIELMKELKEKDPASRKSLFKWHSLNSTDPLGKKWLETKYKEQEKKYKPSTSESLALFRKYQKHRKKTVKKYGYHRYIPLVSPDCNLLDENYNYTSDNIVPDFAGFIEGGVDCLYKWELKDYSKLDFVFDGNELGCIVDYSKTLPEKKPFVLLLEVDLRRPDKDLKKAFNKLITEKKDIIRKLYKSSENNPRWEDYKKYLQVFDLKTFSERLSLYEIGCRLFPEKEISKDKLNKKIKGEGKGLKQPLIKEVDRYYRKAKQLISNATRHDFPGPTS